MDIEKKNKKIHFKILNLFGVFIFYLKKNNFKKFNEFTHIIIIFIILF